MHCFSFFRNQLWQHLIIYNSFRNMNMCLLEVAMYEKCRSSDFQSERGSKKFKYCRRRRGRKLFGMEVGYQFGSLCGKAAGGSVPHYMQCNFYVPVDTFHCAKFKNSYSRSSVMTMHHSWTQYGQFASNNFFWKIILIPIYFLAPFIVQNLKKASPSGSRVMRICNVWAQNNPSPQWEFFQKTC